MEQDFDHPDIEVEVTFDKDNYKIWYEISRIKDKFVQLYKTLNVPDEGDLHHPSFKVYEDIMKHLMEFMHARYRFDRRSDGKFSFTITGEPAVELLRYLIKKDYMNSADLKPWMAKLVTQERLNI